MPPPDLRARYIELVERLGDEMGKPVGWRRRVAADLGIDESTLSKILSGKRVVGWDLADRAVQRLKLDRDYFAITPESSGISPSPRSSGEVDALIAKFDAGKATVKDVYALARGVLE